jgi:hypothetical protein
MMFLAARRECQHQDVCRSPYPGNKADVEVDVTRFALQKFLSRFATGLSAIALVLVAANVALVLANQSRQAEIVERQQNINQTAELSQVSTAVIRALAQHATDDKDQKLLDLLTENGMSVSTAPAAAAPAPAPPLLRVTPAPPSSATIPPAEK